jgi:hypothetical protein
MAKNKKIDKEQEQEQDEATGPVIVADEDLNIEQLREYEVIRPMIMTTYDNNKRVRVTVELMQKLYYE